LVINVKQFVVGREIDDYLRQVERLAEEHRQELIVCPSLADLGRLKDFKSKYLSVFSQRVENSVAGERKTGSICIESVKANAQGSLLNHAESRLYGIGFPEGKFKQLMEIVFLASERELPLIVCADSPVTAKKIAVAAQEEGLTERLALAVEWDEFIGQRLSMVEKKPGEIIQAVKAVHSVNQKIPVYCGAGVEKAEEIKKAVKEFGAQGALAATGFTKAPAFEGDYLKALESVFKAFA
jgi:triosephosphate isomerase